MMMQTLPWSKAPLGRGDGFDLYNKLFYDMMCKTRNVMNVKKARFWRIIGSIWVEKSWK